MALYHVTQYPKPKHRAGMVTMNVIVEAKTAADALRQARDLGAEGSSEKWFGDDPYYCAPKAKALKTNMLFST